MVAGVHMGGARQSTAGARGAADAGGASAGRLRALVDALPDLVATVDAEQRYCFNNKAYEDWFGIRAEELSGRSLLDVLGPEAYAVIEPHVRRALAGERVRFECEVPYAQGGTRWVEAEYIPQRDGGFHVLVRDANERRASQQLLRESEARKTAMIETALDAVVSIDGEGRIAEFNPAAERAFGYRREAVLGQRMDELLIPKRLRGKHRRGLAAYLDTGQTSILDRRRETQALRADGSEFPIELAVTKIPGSDPPTFTAYVRDITERKRAEDLAQGQTSALASIALGQPLEETLDALMLLLERQMPGMRCAIMQVAEDGRHFRRGRGPSLPDSYHDALAGAPLAEPYLGACGEAADTGKPVVVVDIDADARFAPAWRERLLALGIRSCRSTPVFGKARRALASFALYGAHPGDPTPDDPRLLDAVAQVAAIAIERDASERALRESEARFREVAHSAPAPVWMTNKDGKVEFVNRAFETFAGLSAEALLGDAWMALVHPDDWKAVAERRAAAWKNGHAAYAFDARFKGADGAWRWMEVSSSPRRDAGGGFHGYAGLAVDRTDARRAEAELRESERRFRLMSENAPVLIWMSDAFGACQHLNRLQREFWAVGDDLAAFDWSATIHPEDVAGIGAATAAAMQSQAAFCVQGRYRRADGAWRVLRTEAHPRFGEDGVFLGMIGVNVDVTDAIRAQERQQFLLKLGDRIRALRQPHEVMAAAAEALGARLGVDRCGYAEIDEEGASARIESDWTFAGMPSLIGQVALGPFGPFAAELRSGRTLAVADAAADPRGDRRAAFDAIGGVRAALVVPLHKAGRWTATLFAHHRAPRAWSDEDISLIQEVAERTWAEIERARAERMLQASETRFRAMVDTGPTFIWAAAPDGRITFHNQRWLEYTGLDAGKNELDWPQVLHPDDAERCARAWRDALASGADYEIEVRNRGRDGSHRWFLTRARPTRDSAGRIVEWVGSTTDIHDRKLAVEALRDSEARYRAVVESQSEMVCRFTRAGDILFINNAYARSLQKTPESLVGANAWAFIPEAEHAHVRSLLDGLTPEAPQISIENRFSTADGDRWTLWTNRALAFDADGRWTEAQSAGIDISDRKQAEEHRKFLLDELNHRVKNTLAVVQGIAWQTFKADRAAAPARLAFEGRLGALAQTHGLLTRTNWESTSLQELAAQVTYAAGAPRGRLLLEGPGVQLHAKEALAIGMALHELTTNALKYGALSNAEGQVDLRWQRTGHGLHIEWRESGGPPVAAPQHRGYGTMMIEKALAHELAGNADLQFEPYGLRCEIHLPEHDGSAAP